MPTLLVARPSLIARNAQTGDLGRHAPGIGRVPLRENGDESHRTLPLRSNQL
jgi:hypothetical protein